MRSFHSVVVSLIFISLAAAGPLPQDRRGRLQRLSLRVAAPYSHTAVPILPRDDTLSNFTGAAALDPNPAENAATKEPTFATIRGQPVGTPQADPAAGAGGGGSKHPASGSQEAPENQLATGVNPDISQPTTGPSPDLSQPASGPNSNLNQPATDGNPDLNQPATGANPELSQPVTGVNPDLKEPATGADGNDDKQPATGPIAEAPVAQPVTGPGSDIKDPANGPSEEAPASQPISGAGSGAKNSTTGPSQQTSARQPVTGPSDGVTTTGPDLKFGDPVTGANPSITHIATGLNQGLNPSTSADSDVSNSDPTTGPGESAPVTGESEPQPKEPATGPAEGSPANPVAGPGEDALATGPLNSDIPVVGSVEEASVAGLSNNQSVIGTAASNVPLSGADPGLTPITGANPDLSNNDPATGANADLADGNPKHSHNNVTEAATGPSNSSERLPKDEVNEAPVQADAGDVIITPTSALRTINTDPTAAVSYVAPVSVLSSIGESGLEVSATIPEGLSSTETISSAQISDITASADLSIETPATIIPTSTSDSENTSEISTSVETTDATLSITSLDLTSGVTSVAEIIEISTTLSSESNFESVVPSKTSSFFYTTGFLSSDAPSSSIPSIESSFEIPNTALASFKTTSVVTASSSSLNFDSQLTTTVVDGTTFVGRLPPSSTSPPTTPLPSSVITASEMPSSSSSGLEHNTTPTANSESIIPVPTIISQNPTPTSMTPQNYASNLASAELYNTSFLSLDTSSTCRPGSIACVNGKIATCSSSSTFEITECGAGEQCFALPMPNAEGVYVGCYDIAKAKEMLLLPSSAEVTNSGTVVVQSTVSQMEVEEGTSTIYQTLESTIYVTIPAPSATPTPEAQPEQPAAVPAPVLQPQAESQALEPTAAAELSESEPVALPTPAPAPSPEPTVEAAQAITTVQNNVEQDKNEQLLTITVTQIVTETQVLERTKTETATETQMVTVTSAPPGFNLGFGQ